MRKAAVLNWLIYKFASLSRQRPARSKWAIGVYKADRLGDFILSIGAIRAVVDSAGAENCVIIHSAVASEIAQREFPGVGRIELPQLDGRLWVTYGRLREFVRSNFEGNGIGKLICLRHYRSLSDELALQALPASEVWCVRNSPVAVTTYELVRDRFEGDVVVDRPIPGSTAPDMCEDLECHERIVARLDAREGRVDLRPRLASSSPGSESTLALAPFGSDRVRDLPIEDLIACVGFARVQLGLSAVLLTPPGDAGRYRDLCGKLEARGEPVNLRVTKNCEELIDAVASCAAIVTTETATAHIATALDKPMVCLIGGGHFGHFGPWRISARQHWVTNRVACFNCGWQCPYPTPTCITGIRPEMLRDALASALNVLPATTLPAQA